MVNNRDYVVVIRRSGWIYSCGFIEAGDQPSWKVIGGSEADLE